MTPLYASSPLYQEYIDIISDDAKTEAKVSKLIDLAHDIYKKQIVSSCESNVFDIRSLVLGKINLLLCGYYRNEHDESNVLRCLAEALASPIEMIFKSAQMMAETIIADMISDLENSDFDLVCETLIYFFYLEKKEEQMCIAMELHYAYYYMSHMLAQGEKPGVRLNDVSVLTVYDHIKIWCYIRSEKILTTKSTAVLNYKFRLWNFIKHACLFRHLFAYTVHNISLPKSQLSSNEYLYNYWKWNPKASDECHTSDECKPIVVKPIVSKSVVARAMSPTK